MKRINTDIFKRINLKYFLFISAFLLFSTAKSQHDGHAQNSTPHDSAALGHTESVGHGHNEEEETFSAATMGNMIMHHIRDDYFWHFFDIGGKHYTLYLPIIAYNKDLGLQIFSSKHIAHGEAFNGLTYYHGHLALASGNNHAVYDFSITKNVASMILSLIILCLIFITVAKSYAKRGLKAPKGLQSFMEPLILFVRDEIAKPNLGRKANAFTPYLLTLFFFIWINNLLGLLPGAANLTGNITVTVCLALLTLILTNMNGNKHYWGHIFWPPGVPLPIKFILIPVEIVGILTKPFALLIRLFANITAGHIIILSILSLIFLFGESGKNAIGGFGASAVAIPFAVFLYCLELLVAALQAFIFTMLTALFIGQASADHEHHAEEGAHH
jgi:F-type H+-transporting ATPase subunit a